MYWTECENPDCPNYGKEMSDEIRECPKCGHEVAMCGGDDWTAERISNV